MSHLLKHCVAEVIQLFFVFDSVNARDKRRKENEFFQPSWRANAMSRDSRKYEEVILGLREGINMEDVCRVVRF
ncbi:hypothetical protein BgiMline_012821 [Biomphalaria glabrata]